MFEPARVDIVPLNAAGYPAIPGAMDCSLRAPRLFCVNDLNEMSRSVVFDRWAGLPRVHLNLGVAPHVLIDSETHGLRVLSPVLEAKDWPDCPRSVRYLVKEVVRMIFESDSTAPNRYSDQHSKLIPNGAEIQLYVPPLNYRGSSHFGLRLITAEFEKYRRENTNGEERAITFKAIFSGTPVTLAG